MALKDLIPWKRHQKDHTESDTNDPLDRFHWNINRILNDIMDGWSSHTLSGNDFISPRIDLSEKNRELTITADMPGMDENHIDVYIQKNTLVIRGQKKVAKEDKEHHYYHMERFFGSFYRTIPLPCEIDENRLRLTTKKEPSQCTCQN